MLKSFIMSVVSLVAVSIFGSAKSFALGAPVLVAGRRGSQLRGAVYRNRAVALTMIALALLAPSAFATPVTLDADTHTPVGVTASSFLPEPIFDRSPVHTIDNSGLTGNAHATGSADGTMWTSNGNGLGSFTPDYAPAITFDLGRILNVSAMDIWNYNESGPGFPNNPYLGAKSVQVLAGATLGTLTNVGSPVTFAEATGLATYTGDVTPLVVNDVRFIEFKILTTWEGATFGGTAGTSTDPGPDGRYLTGLSEVKFEATTPEPSTFVLAGFGLVGLMVAGRRSAASLRLLSKNKLTRTLAVAMLIAMLLVGSSQAALIAEFSADSLAAGSTPTAVNTWTDLVGGGQAATTASSGKAAPSLYGLHTAGYSSLATAGTGHSYVTFDGATTGLATTSALFSGGSDRTVVVVYQNNVLPSGTTFSLAGGTGPQTSPGDWFMVQARNAGPTSDPYLAGNNADVNPAAAPAAGRLTFAVASYDGSSALLSWAYGVNGSVSSLSSPETYSTNNVPFTIGSDYLGAEFANAKIAEVLVFSNTMNSSQQQSEIQALQAELAVNVPEPSTFVLAGVALAGLLVARRRK